MSTSSATNPSTSAFTGTIVTLGGSANIDGTFPPGPSTQKQVTSTLAPGTYFWHVRARHTISNFGPYSATFTLVVDTTAPAAPTIDPITSPRNTPISTITGTAEAGSSVQVYDNDVVLESPVTADATTGVWTLNLVTPLSDGSYSFTAIATDALGNPGAESSPSVDVTVETTVATIETSLSLQLSGNSKATPGALFTASGKLIDFVADTPIAGQEISVTINGLSPVTTTTNNKGEFSVQLTAPTEVGNQAIQAHFEVVDQYDPSDSPVRTLKVEGAAPADTSLTLQLSKNKVNAGSSYSVSGTLINEITKKPISGMTISMTTDGSSPQTGTTDSKGKYDIQLTAHFAGNSQYESSDSPIKKVKVQGGTTFALQLLQKLIHL